MKKVIQLLIGLVAVFALTIAPVSAQEYGQKYTRGVLHLTDKTTHAIVAQNVTLYTLIVTVTTAGSSWTITVQDAAGTPHILYAATAAAGTTVIPLPVGVLCTSGLSIVGGGTTAGVADVWYTYR